MFQYAVIADKTVSALAPQNRLDHRMPPVNNFKIQAVVQNRTHIIVFGRQFRQSRCHIKLRHNFRRFRNHISLRQRMVRQLFKNLQFHRQRPFVRRQDLAFQPAQFVGRESDRIKHRLPVDKLFVFQQFVRKLGRYFDIISDNRIVFDLQNIDARFLSVLLPQYFALFRAFLSEIAQMVKRRTRVFFNKSAVPRQYRQILALVQKHPLNVRQQRGMVKKAVG